MPNKIAQKVNKFVRDTTKKFTPVVKDEITKSISKTTENWKDTAWTVVKVAFVGALIFENCRTGHISVPIAPPVTALSPIDIPRVVNISYNETNTYNYYGKDGK